MAFRHVLYLLFAPKLLEEESCREGDQNEEEIKRTVKARRKGLISTLPWILAPAILGFSTAQAINHKCTIPAHLVPWLRLLSLSVLAFAALSRLSEEQTIDGSSLPERTNVLLFKLLYGLGFFLSIATLSLDIRL